MYTETRLSQQAGRNPRDNLQRRTNALFQTRFTLFKLYNCRELTRFARPKSAVQKCAACSVAIFTFATYERGAEAVASS